MRSQAVCMFPSFLRDVKTWVRKFVILHACAIDVLSQGAENSRSESITSQKWEEKKRLRLRLLAGFKVWALHLPTWIEHTLQRKNKVLCTENKNFWNKIQLRETEMGYLVYTETCKSKRMASSVELLCKRYGIFKKLLGIMFCEVKSVMITGPYNFIGDKTDGDIQMELSCKTKV